MARIIAKLKKINADTVYTGCPRLNESVVNDRFLKSFGDENSNTKMLRKTS